MWNFVWKYFLETKRQNDLNEMHKIFLDFWKNIVFYPSYGQKTEKKCISTTLLYGSVGFTNQNFKSFCFLFSKKYSEVRFDPTTVSNKTPHK